VINEDERIVTELGVAVATEAGLARLGDRMENAVWSVMRTKMWTIATACLLSAAIGGGAMLLAFKIWPHRLAGAFDLPRVEDNRLVTLNAVGATLVVKQSKGTTYIYFTGSNVRPLAGQTRKGMNYLYIEP